LPDGVRNPCYAALAFCRNSLEKFEKKIIKYPLDEEGGL
jgi:hypothetical protein